jgi:uncharacterized protein (DUF1800 family)
MPCVGVMHARKLASMLLRQLTCIAWLGLALCAAPSQAHTQPPVSEQDARRFLTQATFGPTDADTAHVMHIGYEAWLDEQFAAKRNDMSHLAYWDQRQAAWAQGSPGAHASTDEVTASFWRQAITGQDPLRQRVAFALSEIFVVSLADACGDNQAARGVAGYLDMLGAQAFGSYRALLEAVALHPAMGCYLSHLHNQKEDPDSGRVPDENFAREVMQLFSIGLYELAPDGSVRRDAQGQPMETYKAGDVAGLAKVFTGWSWRCPVITDDACFMQGMSRVGRQRDEDWQVAPMVAYARFHAISEKRFLNQTIESSFWPRPEGDVKQALDTLASHPNVGPFLGRQLIQKLVTSNPSAAYVKRVSQAFMHSGGSLQSMVKAILLDPEARDTRMALQSPTFGKLREPVLRLSALMRALDARSITGHYLMQPAEDPSHGLNQSPMRSPTVFNFFRPAYVPPGTGMAKLGLQAPEMQLAHETSVAGYVNFMRDFIAQGTGWRGYDRHTGPVDIQLAFNVDAQHPLLALADDPVALVNWVNVHLTYGTMPTSMQQDMVQTVASLDFTASGSMATPAERRDTRLHRCWTALLLTVASPTFMVQK